MAAVLRPRFPLLFAAAIVLITVIGFSRTYYLRFLADLPPMTTLVHLHGVVFTAWLALVILQVRFIAKHRIDLHRITGVVGIVLALMVIAVTIATVFANTVIPRIRPNGLTPPQASITGFTSTLLFTIFVGLGIAFRRRPAVHRRLMILSLVPVMGPGTSRLLTLLGYREISHILIPIIVALFVAWCLMYDWRKYRIVHPVFAIGGAAVVISWPARMIAGRSDWYQPIANWAAEVGARLH